jgi:Nuclease-related domain
MRIVELSDHPNAMLHDEHERRRKAEEQAASEYARELALHHERLREASARRDEARAEHRWLTWLRTVFAVWGERARAPQPPLVLDGPSDREEILTAGMAGERRLVSDLSSALDDAWVLFRGYHNRGGEIDHLLVGPRGVFAMEGKHRNATVHVDGDHWTYDKYDRYGNLVEQGEITDRGGRSPSMQVNQPADELEKFLRSRGQDVEIRRIVVLTHDRSELGTCCNLTVDVTNSMDHVLDIVRDSPTTLIAGQTAEIERFIERDHHFHEIRLRRSRQQNSRQAHRTRW